MEKVSLKIPSCNSLIRVTIRFYQQLLLINGKIQQNTNQQYDQIIAQCKNIFIKKTADYGTAWRVLRTISIADQIYIKAQRIRTIQEKGNQKIADDLAAEFKGIINYAVIGLIQQ